MDINLTHTRLLVDDIESCRAFYKDVLELEEVVAVDGVYYEFLAGDCRLGLYKRDLMAGVLGTKPAAGGDQIALTFRVPDVDATYAALQAKGAQFVTEPHDQVNWVLRVAHLRDPAGTLIEINASLSQNV
ncbi:MAG: VOC family protein [Anaerolineales bacterium]|nr:VOC family protein [Anaerolineales bacterium]